MKKHLVLLSVMMLIQAAAVSVSAKDRPQVVDTLHFDIKLKESDDLPLVLILDGRSQETGPMPIPRPVAWQKITGFISDKTGPLELANVEEIDENDQIVAQSVTDKRGYFSFTLMDPDHHIRVSCNGFETVEYPIDRKYFDIMLKKLAE